MRTLSPHTYLNDEIINMWLHHIGVASSLPRVKMFTTWFYSKLMQIRGKKKFDYSGVKRWTKKFDVFDLNLVFINHDL